MTVIGNCQGGIGNNLFIVAATLGMSLKHGCDYAIPVKIENPHSPFQQVHFSSKINYLFKDLKELNGSVNDYYEPYFHFKEIQKTECDYLILRGYFQSPYYHYGYKEKILNLLELDNIETKPDVCSIHFRSTDYNNLPNIHPVVTSDYIEEAQIHMMNKGIFKFIYFSDDIEICKNKLPQFYECEYKFSEGRTEVEDLKEMASCGSNIIANSSYSWWAQYINPNPEKIVVAPRTWFGKDMNHDTKDLYLPNWILI